MALAVANERGAGVVASPAPVRRRLLLLFAAADHPHRDAVCATLAWLAGAEGSLFECYWDSRRTGGHYGGGASTESDAADLRGGTFIGGRHLEQLLLILGRFDCEAACLGPTAFASTLAEAGIPLRSTAADVVTFYRELFGGGSVAWPDHLLVIGDGNCGSTSLRPYAFPEVVHRRLLAVGDGDPDAVRALRPGMTVEALWTRTPPGDGLVSVLETPPGREVADQTLWMANRWATESPGMLLGDPELISRFIPTAVRSGWAPVYGIPQSDVIERSQARLRLQDVVIGRQQDDRDFLALSRVGTAFQLVDPGRPPFPVIREAPVQWPAPGPSDEPDDGQLDAWAADGRILTSLLFWTGMAREIESLYALADVLALTGLCAGLVLTTESYAMMARPPLTLIDVPRALGGLAPRVEALLGSAGAGAMLESEAPLERFAGILRRSVDDLAERLGGRELCPRGWWSTMDAPLVWRGVNRVGATSRPPFLRMRYRPRPADLLGSSTGATGPDRRDLRTLVRATPLRHLTQRLRPFDGYVPGPPQRALLAAVRDAGFTYAFTKSGFGGPPRVVDGVDGLVVMTYTSGRWDGWTPFETVNDLADLRVAERRLGRNAGPGWLVGTLDSCLWAFGGPLWSKSAELERICRWTAGGGSTGRLVNVTPHTLARYARRLHERRQVETLPAQ